VTRLMSDEQFANYGPWLYNERRLRCLVAVLEALRLEVAEHDPRWDRCPAKSWACVRRT
jgi:hypothetical protein